MRKRAYALLVLLFAGLVSCVTINVYFPEAAAQKAADQFIGNVMDSGDAPARSSSAPPPATQPSAMLLNLLIPAASAAQTPNLQVDNATTKALRSTMRLRFRDRLKPLLESGAIGFTQSGLVAVRDLSKLTPAERAAAHAAVSAENKDRNALYREIAKANGHPEWEAQIRATFARGWIDHARSGWYYQDAAGAWKRR